MGECSSVSTMKNANAINVDSNAVMYFFILCCSVGHASIVVHLLCNNGRAQSRRASGVDLQPDVSLVPQYMMMLCADAETHHTEVSFYAESQDFQYANTYSSLR